jgi:hypothetical protein
VTIFRRGDRFVVTGTNAERAVEVLERFYEKADRPVAVDDIQLALVEQRANAAADEEAGLPPLPARRGKPLRLPRAAAAAADDKDSQDPLPESPILKTRKHDLRGRTPHQSQYLNAILEHDITFGVGPAGTGKTYLAVACAVDALERDAVQRIVLTRPAVEAGERLGFLPGDLAQKVDPCARCTTRCTTCWASTARRSCSRSRPSRSPAGLHARPHAQPRLHHPRRGAEHHAGTDEDVPDPHRLRQQGRDHRRRHPGRPAHGQKSGLVDALSVLPTCAASPSRASPVPTWCAIRWWRASSMPMMPPATPAPIPRAPLPALPPIS